MGGNVRWDGNQDATLRRILAEGASHAEAGAEMGRTAKAVERRVGRLGWKFPGRRPGGAVRPLRRAAVMSLLGQGCTLSEAARRLGLRQTSVQAMVRRLVALGLLRRTGGATRACRYVPTPAWADGPRRGRAK